MSIGGLTILHVNITDILQSLYENMISVKGRILYTGNCETK